MPKSIIQQLFDPKKYTEPDAHLSGHEKQKKNKRKMAKMLIYKPNTQKIRENEVKIRENGVKKHEKWYKCTFLDPQFGQRSRSTCVRTIQPRVRMLFRFFDVFDF